MKSYTYLISHTDGRMYYGVRTCKKGTPAEDTTYWGSSERLKKIFYVSREGWSKTIIKEFDNRKEASLHELELIATIHGQAHCINVSKGWPNFSTADETTRAKMRASWEATRETRRKAQSEGVKARWERWRNIPGKMEEVSKRFAKQNKAIHIKLKPKRDAKKAAAIEAQKQHKIGARKVWAGFLKYHSLMSKLSVDKKGQQVAEKTLVKLFDLLDTGLFAKPLTMRLAKDRDLLEPCRTKLLEIIELRNQAQRLREQIGAVDRYEQSPKSKQRNVSAKKMALRQNCLLKLAELEPLIPQIEHTRKDS